MRIRSVSAKLLLAMTVAVLLPFLGFTLFVSFEMGDRLSRDVVLYFLKSKASDLADKINLMLAERRKDLRIWVEDSVATYFLRSPEDPARREVMERQLNLFCREKEVYDLILIASPDGRVLATNTIDRYETYLPPQWMAGARKRDLREFPWFQAAAAGKFSYVDWHLSPLIHGDSPKESQNPSDYAVGFAGPIRDPRTGELVGILYNLMNWSYIQENILDRVRRYFSELQTPESYQSGYAWLWKSDADSIIGHKNRGLYNKKVSGDPVYLPQLRDAALQGRWGVFPEYEWPPGTPKNAAFSWTHTREEEGFGWIVGLGIDNEDILATVTELRQVLLVATFLILGGIVVWTGVISRTITGPVKGLISLTEEVARGNLQARTEPTTEDEIGVLTRSFNKMTEDLAASRERAIRAEKEAAWREMARQVAHEIKNPLTPIGLSTNLLQKAYRDQSPEFPKIFEQTTGTILRQIEALRRIAADFSAFAGLPNRRLETLEVESVLKECLELYGGWAQEKGIALRHEGAGGRVNADREELRRLFINLLDNALEAVGSGGKVAVELSQEGGWLRIDFFDTGPGIPPEVQARLFEPYFSTKTTGTGLGLAICKRIVTDLEGSIGVESEPGRGTTVRVRIPLEKVAGTRNEYMSPLQ